MDQLDELYAQTESASDIPSENINVDSREIRALLKIDFEVFIDFFLGDKLDMKVPAFHKEIWRLLTNTALERILLAIPRDHAKTTLSKLAVIWYWVYTAHRFCVYLSSTNAIAKGA